MIPKLSCVLIVTLLLTVALPARSEEPIRLRGGWRQMPPYQYRSEQAGISKLSGLDIEIAWAALRHSRDYATFEERSWADQLESIKAGQQDFALAATPTTERQEFAYFSRPYRFEVDVLYVRRDRLYDFEFAEVGDVVEAARAGRFRVAVVEGFHYGPDVAEILDSATVEQTQSDVQNFESLLAGQVDGLLIDQLEGAAITRSFGWDASLAEYPVPIYSTPISVMFSRASTSEKTVERFNEGLGQAQESGEIDAILDRYKDSRLVSLLLGATGQSWFLSLDLLGTFAFALSGVILARKAGFDIFGGFVLAALPALGGGLMRDLLVGRAPVGIIQNPIYLELVVCTVLLAYCIARKYELRDLKSLAKYVEALDALGLAAFTVIGVLIAAEYRCEPLWLWGPFLAALTGAGGGVLRDALRGRGECPSLQGQFYPEVALIWGLILSLFLSWYVSQTQYQPSELLYAIWACLAGAFFTRIFVVAKGIRSPLF
jgi:polar amino acid transport system substrate-binding protein